MDWNMDVEKISGYRNELASGRDDLLGIKQRIKNYKENINSHWKAEEVYEINATIDDILRDIQKVCNQMEDMEYRVNRAMYTGEMIPDGTDICKYSGGQK